ncbi:MAG: hypothetical protein JSV62_14110 [Promethearchaeota archaeon]|nr:MAG: hypothetical protein JSV62_14110 [Candidatus Lokiarchaeota archaeon]
MKLILKIKPKKISKQKRIIVWIKKKSDLNEDILQLFQLFKDNLKISKISKILRYYVVTSENPAIILNLYSAIQESIPEVYFNKEKSIEIEDLIDI